MFYRPLIIFRYGDGANIMFNYRNCFFVLLIMAILADHEIQKESCNNTLIFPFCTSQLNPASYDVLLGPNLMIETPSGLQLLSIDGSSQADPYEFQPQEFLLAQTIEIFNLPKNIAAEFRLKSSRAREGIDQALAVWCDPGWTGSTLTLELRNNRRMASLPLWHGMKIGQMVFHKLAKPERDYAEIGRYNNDAKVQGSRG